MLICQRFIFGKTTCPHPHPTPPHPTHTHPPSEPSPFCIGTFPFLRSSAKSGRRGRCGARKIRKKTKGDYAPHPFGMEDCKRQCEANRNQRVIYSASEKTFQVAPVELFALLRIAKAGNVIIFNLLKSVIFLNQSKCIRPSDGSLTSVPPDRRKCLI